MSETTPRIQACRNVSTNVTGVVEKLRLYFFRYPNSKPKTACIVLGLNPKRHGATARVVKSDVRKAWAGANIQGDSLEALTSLHRCLWYLPGGVPAGPVLDAVLGAAACGSNRQGAWFSSGNRNGQVNYRSPDVAIRVLPTTRRLEVLCRRPGVSSRDMRERVREILVSTFEGRLPESHDACHIAQELSWKLVPIERHRRFVFPAGPHYRLSYYEDTLGLVVQHDLSENMNEQEAIEKVPAWIPDLLRGFERVADRQREHSMTLYENTDSTRALGPLGSRACRKR